MSRNPKATAKHGQLTRRVPSGRFIGAHTPHLPRKRKTSEEDDVRKLQASNNVENRCTLRAKSKGVTGPHIRFSRDDAKRPPHYDPVAICAHAHLSQPLLAAHAALFPSSRSSTPPSSSSSSSATMPSYPPDYPRAALQSAAKPPREPPYTWRWSLIPVNSQPQTPGPGQLGAIVSPDEAARADRHWSTIQYAGHIGLGLRPSPSPAPESVWIRPDGSDQSRPERTGSHPVPPRASPSHPIRSDAIGRSVGGKNFGRNSRQRRHIRAASG